MATLDLSRQRVTAASLHTQLANLDRDLHSLEVISQSTQPMPSACAFCASASFTSE